MITIRPPRPPALRAQPPLIGARPRVDAGEVSAARRASRHPWPGAEPGPAALPRAAQEARARERAAGTARDPAPRTPANLAPRPPTTARGSARVKVVLEVTKRGNSGPQFPVSPLPPSSRPPYPQTVFRDWRLLTSSTRVNEDGGSVTPRAPGSEPGLGRAVDLRTSPRGAPGPKGSEGVGGVRRRVRREWRTATSVRRASSADPRSQPPEPTQRRDQA